MPTKLTLSDSELFSDPTTCVVEEIVLDGNSVVQLALYSDPHLDGEGVFLSKDKAAKLYLWLKQYLGGRK